VHANQQVEIVAAGGHKPIDCANTLIFMVARRRPTPTRHIPTQAPCGCRGDRGRQVEQECRGLRKRLFWRNNDCDTEPPRRCL